MAKTDAPIILHIPHSSFAVPPEYRQDFLLDRAELEKELRRMTDAYTDELFPAEYCQVVFPVSRLVCDPERFEADTEEPMSKIGMGCLYTHGSNGQLIRKVVRREELLSLYYRPHHQLLTELTDRVLSRFDCCLIIDCHSFSSAPLPYEPDKSCPRPDICIGTDEYHTPDLLLRSSVSFFENKGLSVSVNSPYSGALVPIKHFRLEKKVAALMIEVNRRLYMDNEGMKTKGFELLQNTLGSFVDLCAASF